MAYLIDRRLQGGNKSAVNRDRFLRRYKQQIKQAVARAINDRSITDMGSGEKISIPSRDLNEPSFGHAPGGVWEVVRPGNEEFQQGDRVPRPRGGAGSGGGGGRAGNSEDPSEDDFVFEISRDEFMQVFFEDLALPNLVKTRLASIPEFKTHRAGYTISGTPSNIHVLRSLRGALGRRIAIGGSARRKLAEFEAQYDALLRESGDAGEVGDIGELVGDPHSGDERLRMLAREIRQLRTRLAAIPFLDPIDLRYSNRVRTPKPTTQAVMFCIMDVSGSMDQQKKDVAKRFFILLYLFLQRTYEH
ncbi:MAG: YeaH/YhbH family protein, partial [Burkholderiaceae bacterium]